MPSLNTDRGRREQAAHDRWLRSWSRWAGQECSPEEYAWAERCWRRSVARARARLFDRLEAGAARLVGGRR